MSTKNKESKIPERKIKIFGTISFILYYYTGICIWYKSNKLYSEHSHIVHRVTLFLHYVALTYIIQYSITHDYAHHRWIFFYKHRPGTYTQNIFKQQATVQVLTHSSYMLHYFYIILQCVKSTMFNNSTQPAF